MKRYSIAEKKQIMTYARENNYSAAAKEFKVSKGTLHAWAQKKNDWKTPTEKTEKTEFERLQAHLPEKTEAEKKKINEFVYDKKINSVPEALLFQLTNENMQLRAIVNIFLRQDLT